MLQYVHKSVKIEGMILGYDYLIEIIEAIGHIALFLVLCLGLIGLPIPNEAVALTGGALSQAEVLYTGLAFLMLWLGICSSMTFNYSIGRFTNSKLSRWFTKRQKEKQNEKQNKLINQATHIIDKYGIFAIPISQFFPFLRHATPYLMGVNNMKYLRFIIFAYPTAFVWTMIYFTLGYFLGDQIPDLIKLINRYESILFIILILIVAVFTFVKVRQHLKRKKGDNNTLTL